MTFPWDFQTNVSSGGVTLEQAQNTPLNRPELQRNLFTGFYPGEAETGIPDFLRTFVAASRANSPQATHQNWAPPWASTSASPNASPRE